MKEMSQLNLPDDLRYAKSHEWAREENDEVTVGITDFAQDQLGDVVFVELPEIGSTLSQGDEFGTVESVKAVSEVYMPVSGKVVAINENLADNPALVNEQPYADGWMIKIEMTDSSQLAGLMDKDAYLAALQGH